LTVIAGFYTISLINKDEEKIVLKSKTPEEKVISDTETLERFSIPYLKEKAKTPSNTKDMYYLSEYYRRGFTAPQDFNEALSWFTKLVQTTYRDSADSIKAIEHYKRAHFQKDPEAEFKIGMALYSCQIHLPGAPLYWFVKAAEQNYVNAQTVMGIYYLTGMLLTTKLNTGNAIEKGIHYLLLAAHAEDPKAQFALVSHYLSKGKQELRNGLFWAFKCVQQDSKIVNESMGECQAFIGGCYLKGNLVAKSPSIALYWYRKAAINLATAPCRQSTFSAIEKLQTQNLTEATEDTVKGAINTFMAQLPPAIIDKDQEEYKKNITLELNHERKDNDSGLDINNPFSPAPGHDDVTQPTNISEPEPVPASSIQSQLMLFQNQLDGWVKNLPVKPNDLSGPVNLRLQQQLVKMQASIAQLQLQLIEEHLKTVPADEKHKGSVQTISIEPPPVKLSSVQCTLTNSLPLPPAPTTLNSNGSIVHKPMS
jgi:TPR repeat protein